MRSRMGGAVAGCLFVFGCVIGVPVAAQMDVSNADREAIVATALDYIEGFHQAKPERMARSVHEDLAKRIAMPGQDGVRKLEHMGKETLVDMTERNGRPQANADFSDRVEILDVYEGAAMVRVDADTWVDFLQIAKLPEGWKIVNVLWELRPRADESP